MKKILFYLFYFFVKIYSLLPLKVIHVFSDIVCFVNYYTIGYRKKTILSNMRKSFPEKSEKEIKEICKKFYQNLFDTLFESLYSFRISQNKTSKYIHFLNIEECNMITEQGRDITAVIGHYGNWEWSFLGTQLFKANITYIYQKLQNKFFDKFWLNIRSKFGAVGFETVKVYRNVAKYKHDNIRILLFTLSDQCPQRKNINHWNIFLNQTTAWNIGFEKIASKYGHAVFYFSVNRVKRGFYKVNSVKISDDASKEEPLALFKKYCDLLENDIKAKPELWLWSHKRWKRQPENSD